MSIACCGISAVLFHAVLDFGIGGCIGAFGQGGCIGLLLVIRH